MPGGGLILMDNTEKALRELSAKNHWHIHIPEDWPVDGSGGGLYVEDGVSKYLVPCGMMEIMRVRLFLRGMGVATNRIPGYVDEIG